MTSPLPFTPQNIALALLGIAAVMIAGLALAITLDTIRANRRKRKGRRK